MNKLARIIFATLIVLGSALCVVSVASGQTKSFIPVEGANLKAKIDNAIVAGRANAPGGRFWVAYQFEARPGVAIDFEVVDGNGGVYISMDGTSMIVRFTLRDARTGRVPAV